MQIHVLISQQSYQTVVSFFFLRCSPALYFPPSTSPAVQCKSFRDVIGSSEGLVKLVSRISLTHLSLPFLGFAWEKFAYNALVPFLLKIIELLFYSSFTFTEKLQRQYIEFVCSLYPTSFIVNILPVIHLLHLRN